MAFLEVEEGEKAKKEKIKKDQLIKLNQEQRKNKKVLEEA